MGYIRLASFVLATVWYGSTTAQTAPGCMCIEDSVRKTPCGASHTSTAEEREARREIQERIDLTIEADKAKDVAAATKFNTPDFRVKNLDGSIQTLDQVKAGIQAGYDRIQKVSDLTHVVVDCVAIAGDEATVFINQHFVRTIRLGDDRDPHELVSNITHRETWVRTDRGWMRRYIEELERGPSFVDGVLRTGK